MIILDTNILSALMSEWRGERRIRAWVRARGELPVTTAVNRAELLAGVALLPEGRRRQLLLAQVNEVLQGLPATLPFSPDCAPAYAQVVAVRTRAGRPIGAMDAVIASIALTHGASIATRDVDGFTGLGLTVHNPWAG